MTTQATAKFVPISTRKAGLVAALVRGKGVAEAQTILRFTPKRASGQVGKVLASAIANATDAHGAKERDLVIEQVLIGPGPTLKRARPRAKGSSSPIRHRSCHITVVVGDEKAKAQASKSVAAEAPAKAAVTKKAPAKKPTAKKEEKK